MLNMPQLQNPDRRSLPPGWFDQYDQQHGRWFYINATTIPPSVTWYHPLGAASFYFSVPFSPPSHPPPPENVFAGGDNRGTIQHIDVFSGAQSYIAPPDVSEPGDITFPFSYVLHRSPLQTCTGVFSSIPSIRYTLPIPAESGPMMSRPQGSLSAAASPSFSTIFHEPAAYEVPLGLPSSVGSDSMAALHIDSYPPTPSGTIAIQDLTVTPSYDDSTAQTPILYAQSRQSQGLSVTPCGTGTPDNQDRDQSGYPSTAVEQHDMLY
ncbi:hypothetical protein CERSUDRAFT_114571 [Gelatoporia subvermispora B]|uniref:WW domain-containing protein n=1 Tax=Ceriporiopsis subvermispora (strain B) TaxID=914234 RepID=M2QLP3_CERS8|nr:hypothetical protein CERSUDRAFT_114571 [Gelatoporia subvermispora B]